MQKSIIFCNNDEEGMTMSLPDFLEKIEEDCAIVVCNGCDEDGNPVLQTIDDFIAYISSGQALEDWTERLAQKLKELEELF